MKITINGADYILLTKCPLTDTTERLEFLTDVHQSVDSAEYRLPLRDQPRQTFNYSLLAYKEQVGGVFSTFYEGLRSQYLIPQMLEYITVNSFSGDFVPCDTSLLSVSAGQFILISEQAALVEEIGRYQVIDDEPVYQDGYRIHTEIEATNPRIQPLRLCIIDGDMTAQMNSFVFKPTVTFRVIDTIDYPVADEPAQYNGQDYYDWCVLLNGEYIDINFNQHQVIVDGDLGGFWSYTDWLSAKKMFNLRILMRNRQEYIDFKKWLYRRRGRLNPFYLPMVEGDEPVTRLYRLNSDAMEFQFKGGAVVECTVPLVELSE